MPKRSKRRPKRRGRRRRRGGDDPGPGPSSSPIKKQDRGTPNASKIMNAGVLGTIKMLEKRKKLPAYLKKTLYNLKNGRRGGMAISEKEQRRIYALQHGKRPYLPEKKKPWTLKEVLAIKNY